MQADSQLLKDMKRTENYFVEFDFKLWDKTMDDMEGFLAGINEVAKKYGVTDTRASLKQNPTYDSFGNLW